MEEQAKIEEVAEKIQNLLKDNVIDVNEKMCRILAHEFAYQLSREYKYEWLTVETKEKSVYDCWIQYVHGVVTLRTLFMRMGINLMYVNTIETEYKNWYSQQENRD